MKVGIYVRVSSQHQAEKWSLPAQRDALAKHAEAKGWTWELYDEGGVSAESITARPVFQKLLLDALGQLGLRVDEAGHRTAVALALDHEVVRRLGR